jgi:protein-S-isoprenylcysteine O-methyltransferase Ste14
MNPTLGKVLYAALFVVVIPVALVVWTMATDGIVALPVLPSAWAGVVPLTLGAALMVMGAGALWVHGRGLPMSPYPPPAYVTKGIFRVVAHPIYVGAVLLCFGVAMVLESASGVWLTTPAVALACMAMVLGHEHHELRRRFGAGALHKPLIALPAKSREQPSGWDRVSVLLLALVPAALTFMGLQLLGPPPDAAEVYLPIERTWPVLAWTEVVYGSAYVLVIGAVFVAKTRVALRRFAVIGLMGTAIVALASLCLPLVAPPRPFADESVLGRLLEAERAFADTTAVFPAFHVVWSLVAAEAWASRGRWTGLVVWCWALLIAVSCVTTGMYSLVDVIIALELFFPLQRYRVIWEWMRRSAERIANSWRTWRVGSVRLIVHGTYAGLGGAVGFLMAATFAGPGAYWQLVFVHFAALIGAGMWAQTLEGSSKLSRPFGYYGGVVGGIGGSILIGVVYGNTMLLIAALALAFPWAQAIGRLRCLVQGCCHGSEAPEALGIRYWQEKSRVVTIGNLGGVPLHPTPLYSILSNVVIGLLLFRVWSLGANLSLVVGAYLMLTGVARFIEESYRGEPQTLIIAGLRIYQWLAMLLFAGGAIVMTIPSGPTPGLAMWLDLRVPVTAMVFGACAGFAMGVDFPGSGRRFARLADP